MTRFPNNDVGDLISTEHDWVVVPDVLSGRRECEGGAEDLWHASAAMTLDIYADLFDDDLEAVATALDQARSRSTHADIV